jgi:hypothetical protein
MREYKLMFLTLDDIQCPGSLRLPTSIDEQASLPRG